MTMDKDLEKILNDLWEQNPRVTPEFAQTNATLLLVQELRNLQKCLKKE